MYLLKKDSLRHRFQKVNFYLTFEYNHNRFVFFWKVVLNWPTIKSFTFIQFFEFQSLGKVWQWPTDRSWNPTPWKLGFFTENWQKYLFQHSFERLHFYNLSSYFISKVGPVFYEGRWLKYLCLKSHLVLFYSPFKVTHLPDPLFYMQSI